MTNDTYALALIQERDDARRTGNEEHLAAVQAELDRVLALEGIEPLTRVMAKGIHVASGWVYETTQGVGPTEHTSRPHKVMRK